MEFKDQAVFCLRAANITRVQTLYVMTAWPGHWPVRYWVLKLRSSWWYIANRLRILNFGSFAGDVSTVLITTHNNHHDNTRRVDLINIIIPPPPPPPLPIKLERARLGGRRTGESVHKYYHLLTHSLTSSRSTPRLASWLTYSSWLVFDLSVYLFFCLSVCLLIEHPCGQASPFPHGTNCLCLMCLMCVWSHSLLLLWRWTTCPADRLSPSTTSSPPPPPPLWPTPAHPSPAGWSWWIITRLHAHIPWYSAVLCCAVLCCAVLCCAMCWLLVIHDDDDNNDDDDLCIITATHLSARPSVRPQVYARAVWHVPHARARRPAHLPLRHR